MFQIKEHQQSVQEETLSSGDMLMVCRKDRTYCYCNLLLSIFSLTTFYFFSIQLCNKELAEWQEKLEKARNRNKEIEAKFAERKQKFISAVSSNLK